MEKIIIAVGSTRQPKLNAVKEALDLLGSTLGGGAEFEVTGVEVPSGVSHTPLSREAMMAGARQRAEALMHIARVKNEPWKYFAGLEGGLNVVEDSGARWVFLESWAYILDTTGRGSYGQSGAILVPDALAQRVVNEGVELAQAIDEFAGGHGIRDA